MKTPAFATLAIFAAFALVAFSGSQARSAQNEIKGFRFQTCSVTNLCIEVTADKAWLSQLNGGFTTGENAKVVVKDPKGKIVNEWKGTSSAHHPSLKKITVDLLDGGLVTISTETGSSETLALGKQGARK